MATEYRDSSGRTLADYPRPSVAVDTAALTLAPDAGPDGGPGLAVLLVRQDPPVGGDTGAKAGAGAAVRGRRASWGLPGTFLHPGETLAQAVDRSLRDKAGIHGRHPEQLHVFDDPRRDDRGWVLSAAHLDVVPYADLEQQRLDGATRVAPVGLRVPLRYDHAAIIRLAVERLRSHYAAAPDPWGLLGEAFTISALRAVHEGVLGRPLQKDTFRRAMLSGLDEASGRASGGPGRPAQLFALGSPPAQW